MNTIKIYVNHDSQDLREAFVAMLRLFGYNLISEGKEINVNRMEFNKE